MPSPVASMPPVMAALRQVTPGPRFPAALFCHALKLLPGWGPTRALRNAPKLPPCWTHGRGLKAAEAAAMECARTAARWGAVKAEPTAGPRPRATETARKCGGRSGDRRNRKDSHDETRERDRLGNRVTHHPPQALFHSPMAKEVVDLGLSASSVLRNGYYSPREPPCDGLALSAMFLSS
jgi:hypothetical protein